MSRTELGAAKRSARFRRYAQRAVDLMRIGRLKEMGFALDTGIHVEEVARAKLATVTHLGEGRDRSALDARLIANVLPRTVNSCLRSSQCIVDCAMWAPACDQMLASNPPSPGPDNTGSGKKYYDRGGI